MPSLDIKKEEGGCVCGEDGVTVGPPLMFSIFFTLGLRGNVGVSPLRLFWKGFSPLSIAGSKLKGIISHCPKQESIEKLLSISRLFTVHDGGKKSLTSNSDRETKKVKWVGETQNLWPSMMKPLLRLPLPPFQPIVGFGFPLFRQRAHFLGGAQKSPSPPISSWQHRRRSGSKRGGEEKRGEGD